MALRHVGHVASLWRYPVKSMAAQELDEIEVSWHGFAGDRRWAFVREGLQRSGFPWLTIREQPDMHHYVPSFAAPEEPDKSAVLVRTPGGEELDVIDPSLAGMLGHGARVIKQDRGVFDALALSLVTVQSLDELSRMVGRELEVRRFRPNLVVAGDDDRPFVEDEWVGRELRIGDMTMRADKRDGRCVMVNVDPVTVERDASVLRAIAQEREACFGVYGSVVAPGRVAVGDAVAVVE